MLNPQPRFAPVNPLTKLHASLNALPDPLINQHSPDLRDILVSTEEEPQAISEYHFLSPLIKHLKAGNCIEEAARDIDKILNNTNNQLLLSKTPPWAEKRVGIAEAAIQEFLKTTSQSGMENFEVFPEKMLEYSLKILMRKNILYTSVEDKGTFFNNLSPKYYPQIIAASKRPFEEKILPNFDMFLTLLTQEKRQGIIASFEYISKRPKLATISFEQFKIIVNLLSMPYSEVFLKFLNYFGHTWIRPMERNTFTSEIPQEERYGSMSVQGG